ncbi:MAG: TniQ family protein [Marinomonas sp.]
MLLPMHPQPLEDELLSSWVTRIALENGLYAHTLYKSCLGLDSSIFIKDIDKFFAPRLIDSLEEKTGLTSKQINKLMLTGFEGRITEKLVINSSSRWILPLGIYHRTRKNKGVVYCPQCFAENPIKYYKRIWRLSFVVMCEKHHCLLRDCCPHCGSPIDFQRLGIGKAKFETPYNDLGLCSSCTLPLWTNCSSVIPSEYSDLTSAYLSFLKAFSLKQPCLPLLKQPMELQEFNGLWVLISSILRKRYFNSGVRANILKFTGIDIHSSTGVHVSFDQRPILERFKILLAIFWILDKWPDRLILLANDTQYSQSTFQDLSEPPPYWLDTVIHRFLDKTMYTATDDELLSIQHYLMTHSIVPTAKTIALFANMNKGTCRDKLKSIK